MDLVLLAVYGVPFFELFLDIRLSDGRQQGGDHVLVGGDAVELRSRLDDTGPLDEGRHAEAALPGRSLLAVEGDGAAVGPGEGLGAVVGGVEDDGVVVDAELLELGEDTADVVIVLEHAVGIEADAALAFPLLAEVGPDVHARRGHPGEEGLVGLVGPLDEVDRRVGELVVRRLHALFRHGPGVLDLLAALAVGPAVDHAAGAELLPELGILRVVVALRLLLGVEVVEVAEELVEAVDRRQMFVLVAQVVLAELPARVAVGLEERGERHHLVADPLVRAGHPDGEQTGAEGVLAEDEGRPPGGAALLGVPVGEERPFLCHGVDVGRLVAHHPLVVGADVPVADVVAPDDQDVGFVFCRKGCRASQAKPQHGHHSHSKRFP